MRRALAIVAVAALLGCQGSGPRAVKGTFQLQSSGRVLSLTSLADEGRTDEPATSLEIGATGAIQAEVDGAQNRLRLVGVQIYRVTGGERILVSAQPASWSVGFVPGPRGVEGFQSERELTQEQLWVTRCVLSYWRLSPVQTGSREELELDGANQVVVTAGGQGVQLRTWKSREDDRADLADFPGRLAVPVTNKISGTLEYKAGHFVTSIVGTKRTFSSVGGRAAANSTLEVKVSQEAGPPPEPWPLLTHQYPMVAASKADENEEVLQRKFMGTDSLEETLKAVTPALKTEVRNKLFLALRARFYLVPESCESAVRLAKRPEERRLVAEALAATGSRRAQVALAPMIKDDEGLLALLIPLTRMEPEVEDLLVRLAFDPKTNAETRYQAQLVLGGNIRRCLTANPDQAGRLSARLIRALRTATSDDDRLNLLCALGNAGDPANRAEQLRFLRSASGTLRAAAVHSVRHMLDAETRSALESHRKKELNDRVLAEIEEVTAVR